MKYLGLPLGTCFKARHILDIINLSLRGWKRDWLAWRNCPNQKGWNLLHFFFIHKLQLHLLFFFLKKKLHMHLVDLKLITSPILKVVYHFISNSSSIRSLWWLSWGQKAFSGGGFVEVKPQKGLIVWAWNNFSLLSDLLLVTMLEYVFGMIWGMVRPLFKERKFLYALDVLCQWDISLICWRIRSHLLKERYLSLFLFCLGQRHWGYGLYI